MKKIKILKKEKDLNIILRVLLRILIGILFIAASGLLIYLINLVWNSKNIMMVLTYIIIIIAILMFSFLIGNEILNSIYYKDKKRNRYNTKDVIRITQKM